MSKNRLRDRLRALASDRRAWIPFAVIGLLLLVISITLVVSLDIRESPEPDIDEQLAYDRSESATQATVRTAVRDATVQAADAPVTDPNLSNEFGQALDTADPPGEDSVFRNYLRLLIYQQTAEQLASSSQQVRGVTTNSSLPPLPADAEADTIRDRIERVELDIGHESADLDVGELRVRIDGVTHEIENDSEVVQSRTSDIEVTVATTLFELHNRTAEYERQLEMGFFEGLTEDGDGLTTGFGQEFAARLYPVAYAKSGAKWINPALFEEITSNRQSEVLANHAKYSVQESAFGTTDPNSELEMTIATICLAVSVASEHIADELTEHFDDEDDGSDEEITAEELNNSVREGVELALTEVLDTDQDDVIDSIKDEIPILELQEEIIESGADGAADAICRGLRVALDDETDLDVSVTDLLGSFDQEDSVEQDDAEIPIDLAAAIAYQEIVTESIESPTTFREEFAVDEVILSPRNQVESDLEDGEQVDPNLEENLEGDLLGPFYETMEDVESIGIGFTEGQYLDLRTDVDDVIENVYTVDISDSTDETDEIYDVHPGDLGPPDSQDGWELDGSDEDIEDTIDVSVTAPYSATDAQPTETFYEVDITVTQAVEITEHWEREYCAEFNEEGECTDWETDEETLTDDGTTQTTFEFTIDGEYGAGMDADRGGLRLLEKAYESNGDVGPDTGATNFEQIPERAVQDALSGVDSTDFDASELETLIGDHLGEELSDRVGAGEIADVLYDGPRDEYGPEDILEEEGYDDLREWLLIELSELVYGGEVDDEEGYKSESLLGDDGPNIDPITVDIERFLTDEQPLLGGLQTNVEQSSEEIIYGETSGTGSDYENVPDMARAELYWQYIDRTEQSVDTVSVVRQEIPEGGIVNRLLNVFSAGASEAVDGLLDLFEPILEFKDETLDGAFDDEQPDHAAIEESGLLDDVTFEIHGSPTYLSLDADDRTTTQQVRPAGEGRFAGLDPENPLDTPAWADGEGMVAPRGTDHASMYAGYSNPFPYPGIPVIPGLHAVQFSLWHVDVGGEYARFEVSATTGEPESETTYVRSDRPVDIDIGGESITVGDVEPIDFGSRTVVGVIMPPGGVGDGGPSAWTDVGDLVGLFGQCSDTYRFTGPTYDPDDSHITDILPDSVDDATEALGEQTENINERIPVIEPLPTAEDFTEEVDNAVCLYDQFDAIMDDLFDDEEDS